ncbi:MAG: LytTR family transcriptional regulator DNA-binding domain-containing protein [Bacteroidetes bacterium]|nr:LytTR family transcriptional regulator DNA-binding domain-containing protein [Bacteroidota bacterium]
MNKTGILVVEDESIVAKDIQQSLKKLGYEVLGVCATGEDAMEKADRLKPNLVLMDIMLKGDVSGIDAAEYVRDKLNIPVIFLTAYADSSTLSKAKVTEPYGYIIKPFKEIDLQTNIEIALYKHEKANEAKRERDFLYSLVEAKSSKEVIFAKSNLKLVKIHTKDIYFLESLKDYVTINTKNNRFIIHSTMGDIEKKFPTTEFVRVHRSFIVRIDKIASIDHNFLVVEDLQKQIPISASYYVELKKRLNML